MGVRLRQAVLVAKELDPVAEQLREDLELDEPYVDPNVGEFGLRNVVFAIGDSFLEVVSPIRDGTTAGRYLDRHGDGGYMLIFQLDDLDAARARVQEQEIRIVWQVDLPDISGTHLHPADMGGTIVSLDRADPPESWRWGGPDWTGQAGKGAPGALAGVTVEVPDPQTTAMRWADVLGLKAPPAVQTLAFDGGEVVFREGGRGLTEIALHLPDHVRRGRHTLDVGTARLLLLD